MRGLCISLHDVAPATWPLCVELLAQIDRIGSIPVTLLVVPWYHRGRRIADDAHFRRAVDSRIQRGDEVALHGYTHLDERCTDANPIRMAVRKIYTAGEGEFSSLNHQQAQERLHAGLAAFASAGWTPSGFIAPAWLMSQGTRTALQEFPFTYTSTLGSFIHLPGWRAERSQSLVYSTRARWRTWASLRWNRALQYATTDQPLLRISMHPGDARLEQVVKQIACLVRDALRDRTPYTKAAWNRFVCEGTPAKSRVPA